MPRPATGQVVETDIRSRTVHALRFRAGGHRQYVTLGAARDGWTRERADAALAHLQADVRRGIWKPPAFVPVVAVAADPSFHEARGDPRGRRRARVDSA